jgi:hypothetical protein
MARAKGIGACYGNEETVDVLVADRVAQDDVVLCNIMLFHKMEY